MSTAESKPQTRPLISPATPNSLDFLSGGGEMGERIRSHDWRSTPLGAPEGWPQSLKTAVRIMLTSRQAFWLGWGPELTYLYNDPYKSIIGGKHPAALGQPFRLVWRELWDVVGPMSDQVVHRNEGTYVEAQLLIMERYGYPEETYYTFSYSPVPNDEGGCGGLICANTDDTRRVINERQMATLGEVATRTASARDRHQACQLSLEGLATNPRDMPFSVIFLQTGSGEFAQHASVGASGLEGAARWPCRDVLRTRETMVVPLEHNITAGRGPWPRPPSHAAIVPIMGPARTDPIGVLVVGLNPFRRWDDTYADFLTLLAGQIGTATAAAEAYESERQRAEALAQLDRAKTAFFSNVSHEFRTPLTLMLGPLEAALANPQAIPAPVREELQLTHRNALRLLKLVNNLLDFSRIEAGRMQASFEPTDLARLTRDLASTFRSTIESARLVYSVACEDLREPVYVDAEMWEKVVLNLLSNAFKFTLSGAITVRLFEADEHAVLEVIDTGVGVPRADQPRLFERFYRIQNTRARTHEGSGIGLALVQELVNLHGGAITVTSEPGTGTTFSVRIPLGSAHLPADRLRAASTHSAAATRADAYVQEALRWLPASEAVETSTGLIEAPISSHEPGVSSTAGAHVLLADDNADMRDYVRGLLEPFYHVTTVRDGAVALAQARAHRPDLILSDVMMPELDGFALIAALRSDPATASIPIILLSARAGEEATVEGLQSGADDYLVKPFSSRELLARVYGALALARQRREAAEKLRESEEQFRAVPEASPDGFMVFEAVRDGQGEIIDFKWVYLNEPAARLASQPRASLLGKHLLEVFPGSRTAGLFDSYLRVTETGVPWIGEVHYTQDKVDTLLRLAIARVGDGVAVSSVDISERYRAEEALRLADRQKDEFLAMLAHELRNPLAPIRTASELLTRVVSADPHVQPVVDIVRRQVAHLSRLVDDLLDVSRITQKRIELRREPVEIAQIVAQAVETVEPTIRERRHDLQITSSYRPLFVNGDIARLVQSVVNLLTNAAKYTDVGGHIHITTREEPGRAVIEVADDGAGIPPTLLPKVFDLFVQSDRTLDRSEGGLGIGLSVVQRLIEMHGGDVAAHSEGSGQGSRFYIRLPLVEAPARLPVRAEVPSLEARRVLVVDDNADAADTLSMMLELDGHEISTAYGSRQAIERLRLFRPEIALLDIGLPGMDGYELARRIRAEPGGDRIRLVALTGYGQPEDRARALQEGFDDHLVKPVSPESLTAAFARLAPKPE